jgi:hypothetical protein
MAVLVEFGWNFAPLQALLRLAVGHVDDVVDR